MIKDHFLSELVIRELKLKIKIEKINEERYSLLYNALIIPNSKYI